VTFALISFALVALVVAGVALVAREFWRDEL
jgi:hypothetical protein